MSDEPHDLESLRARVRAGWEPRFLPFWGHRGRGASVGKECLSQWYPAPFSAGGVSYATAEHYMMAAKARLFGDEEMVEKVLAAPDPATAKKLGRRVRGF